MALTSGFFNSLNGDRKYNAEDIASMFDGIITDGIIKNHGEAFNVTANGGNQISVGSGRAWNKHTWTNNDSTMLVNMGPADSSLNRIDAVVLEINKSDDVRKNSIKIVEGTPSASPSRPVLTNSIDISQLPLAYILRPASSTEISQANITNSIGTNECPYASPIIDEVKLTETYGELTNSISIAQNMANTAQNTADKAVQLINAHVGNIAYIETSTISDEASGRNTAEISYPPGFTKDNCVILSIMIGRGSNDMYTYLSNDLFDNEIYGMHTMDEYIYIRFDDPTIMYLRIVLLKVK